MRRVCVFCGSSKGGRPVYAEQAGALGQALARRGLELVFGAGHIGLMGVLADAVLEAGGRAEGVIPRALADKELAHLGLSRLHVVETMHQRKALMFALADAFVVGPGGLGTLEEAFETLTGVQLGYHAKPIVFLDVDGFWTPMQTFLDHAVRSNVLHPDVRALFRIASTARGALDALALVA
jgi:uncharacterized protein (TIGR00730 family)